MSLLTTVLLVLKSLFPFMREVVLRDKGAKEFLLSNKTATGLAACLLVMFVLFYYVKVVADLTHERHVALLGRFTEQEQLVKDQNLLIETLQDRLKNRPEPAPTPKQPDPTTPPIERPQAYTPPKSKHPKQSLKDYAIGRLKAID